MAIKDTYAEIEKTLGLVPEWLKQMPEGAAEGFWVTARDFWLAETEIPNKYKELIGLAVSGATRCKYCCLFHTEAARLFGATEAEIAEASMMSGVTMMGSTFINAQQVDYDKFAAETRDIINYVRSHRQVAAEQAGTEAHHH
ncbi:carboxymuconolactone decarboxylase family protein [Shewanella sp. AS16]|uniref:carboxymuconolactone decarboxylase family protein n=1 Tax=Shewanella sp. AS16 TaxID=2907625 RepID=UPI001F2ED784|nr:carboxymuconolactone decarboxylase family protein [Shewanella sp. AS16]MCE9687016.1 carboxymuconolactone decarboxylase family protein [Shewanella sp. AS16]